MHSFVQVAPRACRPDPREMVLNQYRGISLHATRPGGGQRGGARWTRETGQRRRPREHPAEGDKKRWWETQKPSGLQPGPRRLLTPSIQREHAEGGKQATRTERGCFGAGRGSTGPSGLLGFSTGPGLVGGRGANGGAGAGGVTPRAPSPRNTPERPWHPRKGKEGTAASSETGLGCLQGFLNGGGLGSRA